MVRYVRDSNKSSVCYELLRLKTLDLLLRCPYILCPLYLTAARLIYIYIYITHLSVGSIHLDCELLPESRDDHLPHLYHVYF